MANYRQKTIAEKIAKLVAKIERLPQPMSKELLEKCKQAIIEEAKLGIISRGQLCELFFFFKRNTLKNLDSPSNPKEGIKNPQHIGSRNYVYYHVEDVFEYLEREFCLKPQERINAAKKELHELKQKQAEEQEAKRKKFENLYRTGEIK